MTTEIRRVRFAPYDSTDKPTKGEGWKRNRNFDLTICQKLKTSYEKLEKDVDPKVQMIAERVLARITSYYELRTGKTGRKWGWGVNSGMLRILIDHVNEASKDLFELQRQDWDIEQADNHLNELINWAEDYRVYSR